MSYGRFNRSIKKSFIDLTGKMPSAGTIFHVDGDTGLDTNTGRSWRAAFKTISAAITASEAERVARTNVYIRNTILVAAGAYAAVVALPNYCDIIGVGSSPVGDGLGLVRIGVDGADGIAGSARGLGLYNLQFISGGAFCCADFVTLNASIIDGCSFKSDTHAVDVGLRFTGACSGNIIRNCHWMANADVAHVVGVHIQGLQWDNSLVEDCIIQGTTAGVLVDAGVKNGNYSVFKDNCIGDFCSGCAKAIDDNAVTNFVAGINYIRNSVMGTALITILTEGVARCHGNVSANAFVVVTAT